MAHSPRNRPANAIKQASAQTRTRQPSGDDASAETRELILRAAQVCFGRFSIPKTTVDDIVEEAGVGRTTYYKHFRNKGQLILELSIRETRRINKVTKAFQSQFSDIEEALVESVLFAIEEAEKHEVIKFFLGPASDDLVSEILDRSDEIWDLQTEEWMHLYQLARSQKRLRKGVSAQGFARWVTNVQYLLLTRPLLMGADAEARRVLLRTFLIPSVFSDV